MAKNILLFIALVFAQAAANAAPCDKEYEQVQVLKSHERLMWWERLETPCKKSQRYFLLKGALAKDAVRFANAVNALKEGLKQGGEYNDAISSELAQLYFETGQKEAAESIADALLRTSPNFIGGYWQKANVLLERRDYDTAVSLLNNALEVEEHAHTYGYLAIAYSLKHEDRDAARSMQKAIRADRSELENVLAVCATAYSLTRLGYIAEADDLLSKHLSARPESGSNSEFRRASEYVQTHDTQSKKP